MQVHSRKRKGKVTSTRRKDSTNPLDSYDRFSEGVLPGIGGKGEAQTKSVAMLVGRLSFLTENTCQSLEFLKLLINKYKARYLSTQSLKRFKNEMVLKNQKID